MGEYDKVLGPLVLSVFVNTYLSGVIGFQYLTYRNSKWKDTWIIQLCVGTLFSVDSFQTMVAIYMIWVYCVTNYTDITALSRVELWTFTVISVCNAISGLIVHFYMAFRLKCLSKSPPIIPTCIMIISGVAGVMAFSSGIYGDSLGISMFNHHSVYRSLVIIWVAAQTLVDILIAASLMLYPASSNNPEQVKRAFTGSRSSQVTGKLMRTGSFSAVFSIAVLILFLASKKTSVYIVFLLPLGRLYTNSFLGILQDREKEIKDIQGSGEITTDMWAVPSTTPGNQSFSLNGIRIRGDRGLAGEDMSDADKSDNRFGQRRSSDDRSRMDKIPEMNEPTAVSAHSGQTKEPSDFDTHTQAQG